MITKLQPVIIERLNEEMTLIRLQNIGASLYKETQEHQIYDTDIGYYIKLIPLLSQKGYKLEYYTECPSCLK